MRHFVEEGAKVVFGDVLDERGDAVAAALGAESCRYVNHDVTSEADWSRAVALALDAPDRTALELSWRLRNCSLTRLVFAAGRLSLDEFNTSPHGFNQELLTYR